MNLEKISTFIPEIKEIFSVRYQILFHLHTYGLSGRRVVSKKLDIPERRVRKEVSFLELKGYVASSKKGIKITKSGIQVINSFYHLYEELYVDYKLEKELEEILNIKSVKICTSTSTSMCNKLSSEVFLKMAKNKKVIGITGGTTLKGVVDVLKPNKGVSFTEFVAARGVMGQNAKYQANTLVEKLAKRFGGTYSTLYMPDNLEEETLMTLKKDPHINKSLEQIEKMDLLLFGIGTADSMALQRGLSSSQIKKIKESSAVAETFGIYIDKKGNKVLEVPTLGVSMEKFKKMDSILAIAYGREKANAVMAVCSINSSLVLVIDKDCAEEIKKLSGGKNDKSSN